MKFTFNERPSKGDQGKFELLEPGFYTLTILETYTENQEGKPYKTKAGIDYIRVVCVEKESGLRIFHQVYLDAGQSVKVWYFLKAIGLEPTSHEVDINPAEWIGRMFRGKVIKRTDNEGVERNAIQTCNPLPGEQPEEKNPEPEPKKTWADEDEDEDVPF